MITKLLDKYKYFFWSCEKYARYSGVIIGTGCRIRTKQFGSEPFLIEIGDGVQITSGVKFFTHGGGWTLRKKYPNFDCFGKIKIGNNVYIGNSSLIMPGVTIADNVIVGAGSVVTKSIARGFIVAGNPARVIGDIDTFEEKIMSYNLDTKGLTRNQKKTFLMKQSDDKFIKK